LTDKNKSSNASPLAKKSAPKTSSNNPFKVKMLNEDASDGLKRAFFQEENKEKENNNN